MFEPAAGLLMDLNVTMSGALAFLANLWTMEGHLETLSTLALPAFGLSLGHLLETDHLWQKFDSSSEMCILKRTVSRQQWRTTFPCGSVVGQLFRARGALFVPGRPMTEQSRL